MCGIAGIYVKEPSSKDLPPQPEIEAFVDSLLLGIEHRGRHATGVVAVRKGSRRAHLEKADLPASEFVNWRRPLVNKPRIILGHTRYATQGTPMNLENNHPVQYRSCFVTHNGHISNDTSLFLDNDLERFAEVDSEIIPALITKHGLDKVHLALQKLDGNFAIAAIDPENHPDTLVLAKGWQSPLSVYETRDVLVWASESAVIREAVKDVWGATIPYSEIKTLELGKLLYVEDGTVEEMKFEPYRRTYSYSTSYSSYSSSNSSSSKKKDWRQSPTAQKSAQQMCKCGDTRFWHSGLDYNGMCLKKDCYCKQYVKDKAATKRLKRLGNAATQDPAVEGGVIVCYINGDRHVERRCDGCFQYHPQEEMEKEASYYFCPNCWGVECDACNNVEPPDDMISVDDAMRRVAESGRPEAYLICDKCCDAWNPSDELSITRMIEPEDAIIAATALELGVSTEYVSWLLFQQVPVEGINQEWQLSLYATAHNTYLDIQKRLREGVPVTVTDTDEEVGVRVFA